MAKVALVRTCFMARRTQLAQLQALALQWQRGKGELIRQALDEMFIAAARREVRDARRRARGEEALHGRSSR